MNNDLEKVIEDQLPLLKLSKISTIPPEDLSKNACRKELKKIRKKLFKLQDIFFADGRSALLIIFQGLDAAGKDGTTRRVLSSMNPMGVRVQPFKQPTPDELSHDFLWRIYPHFPAKGMIQVFNRSYYEDIIVPSITKSFSKEEISHRVELINGVEHHLERSKIHVLKFFLHVSNQEQEKRIKERMTQPAKLWKYSATDQEVANRWDQYIKVYDTVINTCNTPEWHIIPADKRWYRNYAVASVLLAYLESIKLRYPKEKP